MMAGNGPSERDEMTQESAAPTGRCERSWGLLDKVACRRKKGHDGLCSGRLDDGRRIVW